MPFDLSSTDDQLMLQLQEGADGAFDAIVQRHQGALLGFFFRHTHDSQLAEDLAQETLLRVFNQSWDYLPRGTFRGWMFRIARNLLIDNSRRRSHDALIKAVRGSNDEEDRLARVVGSLVPPEEKADQNELATLVDGLLQEVPEEQRLTFILHHYAALSLPEVADVMETNLPTTKSRLRLAREKLREKLAKHGITAAMIGGDDDLGSVKQSPEGA